MAIYSLSAISISRAGGKSAVAAAAYRSGQKLADERQGLLHDYTRKGGVLHSEIVLPKVAPIWAGDRERLWNEVDKAEDKSTRRNEAQTARDFRIALPHELNAEQRLAATREFAAFLVDTYGGAVDFAIHAPGREGDERNFHAHVLMTTRTLDGEGFGAKIRSLSSPRTSGAEMTKIRHAWEGIGNNALARAGFADRIDHRTNEAQGRDEQATVHMGVAATGMERKGELTNVGDLNRDIRAANAERAALKAEHAALSAEIINLDAERAKRADVRAIQSEGRTQDPARILTSMTERRSTFSREELNRHLAPFMADVKARSAFMDRVLSDAEIVPLREKGESVVSRYTTRGVLAEEARLFDTADRMAKGGRFEVRPEAVAVTLDRHGHLDDEQRSAVRHATQAGRFAMISGQAGTGKSTTFAAIREAFEAGGYQVKGLAWTNSVVDTLRGDGFRAETVQSELMRLANGRGDWNSRTVLMVDEAAMLSTRHLSQLAAQAEKAGAKLILAGDSRQLSSIERGGAYVALEDRQGAARLSKVYRVRSDDEKAAFNAMHRGDFRAALDTFDKRGALNWTKDSDEARAALVTQWAKDTAAQPDKNRFVFAYTNAEVHALNADLRAIRKGRGELGADHILPTKEGPQAFAVGDRIQFTGSDRDRDRRAAGLFNGGAGTIAAIERNRVTVTLDGPGRAKPRQVSFTVGDRADLGDFSAIRHGYAGTVYKGQGRTVDAAYVLHSDNWRAGTSYVALSRHREAVHLFAAEKPAAWMMAEGGAPALSDKHRASAEKSYAAWAEMKPDLAKRYGFADYVAFVQDQWRDQKDMNRLDRMARQMGRSDQQRAASSYEQATLEPTATPPQAKPPIYGRYAELQALQKRLAEAKQAEQSAAAQLAAQATDKAPTRPLTAAERLAADMAALRDKPSDDAERRAERYTGRDPADERGFRLPDRTRGKSR